MGQQERTPVRSLIHSHVLAKLIRDLLIGFEPQRRSSCLLGRLLRHFLLCWLDTERSLSRYVHLARQTEVVLQLALQDVLEVLVSDLFLVVMNVKRKFPSVYLPSNRLLCRLRCQILEQDLLELAASILWLEFNSILSLHGLVLWILMLSLLYGACLNLELDEVLYFGISGATNYVLLTLWLFRLSLKLL